MALDAATRPPAPPPAVPVADPLPWRRAGRGELHAWTAAWLLAAAALVAARTAATATAGTAFGTGLLVALVGLVCCHRVYRTAENSASFLFVLAYLFFNLGLAPFYLFRLTMPTLGSTPDTVGWLASPLLARAVWLVTLGLVALLFGTCAGAWWGTLHPGRRRRGDAASEEALRRSLGPPACAVLCVCTAVFVADIVLQGGAGAVTSGYDAFRNVGANAVTSYLYPLIGLSGGMVFLSGASWARRVGIAVFVGFCLLMLAVGLRSEVFFPLFGAIVLVGFRRRVLTPVRLVVAVVVAVVLIAAVGVTRNGAAPVEVPPALAGGPALGPSGGAAVNPLSALVEMGYSLRPTVLVLTWQQDGRPPLDGASFASPFYRAAHRVLPELGQPVPAAQDPDILNEVVLQQPGVGAIGFSQPAEAFANWGTAGVVGFLLLVGLVLSWVDRSPPDVLSQLVRVSVFVPLLVEVRNTFTPVPVQIALALTLSYVVVLAARSLARGRRVPAA